MRVEVDEGMRRDSGQERQLGGRLFRRLLRAVRPVIFADHPLRRNRTGRPPYPRMPELSLQFRKRSLGAAYDLRSCHSTLQ